MYQFEVGVEAVAFPYQEAEAVALPLLSFEVAGVEAQLTVVLEVMVVIYYCCHFVRVYS